MDTQGIVLMLTILTIYTVTLSQQANHLVKVEECPSSGTEWKKGTRDFNCTDNKTYHCLPYVQPDKTAKKEFYEGCILFENVMSTSTGSCPQVRDVDSDFAFENEKFMCTYGPDSCPPMDMKYRSDELYKYPGCLGKNKTYAETYITTHSTIIKSQSASLAWIAGIVVPVVILAVIVGCIVYILRKKRRQRSYKDEESNPVNDVDNAAHLESLVKSTSPGSNLQQDEESNHTNGDAVHLEPLDNPTGQGSNSQQGENNVEADVGDGDDAQQDTPQPTETPAGQGHTVNIFINHNYNINDNSKTTNVENAENVLLGNKNTLNNISSENPDAS